MKALVMPNIHTCLARGSLSKHLQNSIIHTLGVENDKVGQSPPNCDTPRRCKMCKISFCLKKVMFYEKKMFFSLRVTPILPVTSPPLLPIILTLNCKQCTEI